MITRIFTTEDMDLYTVWHYEDGGIVSLVVPDVGEVRMSLAKAASIGENIFRKAEYGRAAAGKEHIMEYKVTKYEVTIRNRPTGNQWTMTFRAGTFAEAEEIANKYIKEQKDEEMIEIKKEYESAN